MVTNNRYFILIVKDLNYLILGKTPKNISMNEIVDYSLELIFLLLLGVNRIEQIKLAKSNDRKEKTI